MPELATPVLPAAWPPTLRLPLPLASAAQTRPSASASPLAWRCTCWLEAAVSSIAPALASAIRSSWTTPAFICCSLTARSRPATEMSAAASISASAACKQGESGIAARPQCLVAFRRGVRGCRGNGGREIALGHGVVPRAEIARHPRLHRSLLGPRACSRRGLLLVAAGLGDLGGDAAGLGMVADQQRLTPSDAPASHFGSSFSGQGQGRSAGNRPGRHPPILSLDGNPAASRPPVSEVTHVPFR